MQMVSHAVTIILQPLSTCLNQHLLHKHERKTVVFASVVIFLFYVSPVPLINFHNITEATMLLLVHNQE